MKIEKSWLAKFDWISVTKNGYIKKGIGGYILIEHCWLGKVTDQKVIKLAGLEEVEVDQAGLFKQLFNFGTLIVKGQGVTERLMLVKNPQSYKNYIEGGER